MNKGDKTTQKLTSSIIIVCLLAVCLCVTTFALLYSTLSVDNNLFETGVVKINLNDGKPVIEENELALEPGMTVKKEFFLQNQSSCDVYYKLYFDNIEGGLADVLDITIEQGSTLLFAGKISECTPAKQDPADDILKQGERKELTVSFSFPESAGNSAQTQFLAFDIGADAVQTRNNPNRLFD